MTLVGCGPPETTEGRKIGGEIREALGDVRPIEPRLTLDTGWAPCVTEPRTRSAGTGCSADLLRADLPAPRCSPPPTPETPGFQQFVDIVRGQGGQAHRAALATLSLFVEANEATTRSTIRSLEDLGNNQEALSDLSAAYLHLAGIADRPELLLASLESSSKAIELRPDPPALFNRALVLSRLHLSTASQRAWETYLKAAPADAWTTEAKESLSRSAPSSYQQRWRAEVEPALRRAALGGDVRQMREIVSQHRQRSREWAERDLLSEWASSDGEEARAALRIAGGIGDTLAALGGDRMLAEGVKAISASGDGRRRERLRAGHRELAAGVADLYLHWRLEQAGDHFRRAREHLSASPYALWADFYLGLIAYYQGDHVPADDLLKDLQARFDEKRYPVLEGRVFWIRALAVGSRNQLEDTVNFYLEALKIFCASGEEENVATIHALRAEVLSSLGRFEESWDHLYHALAKSDRIFDPIRHHAVLQVAILNAHRQGLYHAGLAFADEHLRVARLTGSAQILHYSFMHHASLRYALGDLPGAKADLDQATRVKGLEDSNLRERTKADFDLLNAEIAIETNPRGALPLLNGTIREYKRKEFTYLLPQAYGARARAFLRLGDLTSAEQDFAAQIGIYEKSAEEIKKDVFRLSLLDQVAPVFDTMIDLQVTKLGRPDLGLEYCERGRYHAFLDAWTRSSVKLTSERRPVQPEGFDAERLRARLPKDVAILEYSILDDRLLAWVIQRSGVKMIVQEVKRPDLARRIRKLDRALARESVPAASGELYDLLVRPAVPLLGDVTHLVIVPDKELFLVPFEALIDRQSGRYLLEDRTVSYAPSASLHVYLRETRARLGKKAPEHVVAATGALNGGFKYRRLPQAPEEAHSIVVLYPQGKFLGNPTQDQFFKALRGAQILHFSGHAVPNGEQPFASRLVLSDTREKQIELYAYELYDQEFPRLELVVLSACSTAESTQPGLGMAATLAGPFLAAGVPQVIGSQWRVQDEPTRLFFAAFHRHFAEGADAASALRAAKLEFLRSGDALLASPRVWGAFVLIGG